MMSASSLRPLISTVFVPLGRTGATFINGKLVEREDARTEEEHDDNDQERAGSCPTSSTTLDNNSKGVEAWIWAGIDAGIDLGVVALIER